MLIVLFLLLFSGLLLYTFIPNKCRVPVANIAQRTDISYKIRQAMQTRSATCRERMPTKVQEECPFFKFIPGEVRDRIFQYAVTEHAFRKQEYEKDAHYYRPGFRFADQKIDTALLCTCRRVFQETQHLPSQNYVQVEWCYRAPPSIDRQRPRLSVFATSSPNLEALKSLHLFTQQYWLEGWFGGSDTIAKKMPNLQYLKITLRHGDWWSWENSAPLRLDPKQPGTALMHCQSQETDPFHKRSWGYQLKKFLNLKIFELELESIEGKRIELDQIVRRAPGWHFPMNGNQILVLNPSETKRTGRIGLKLPRGTHVPNDPVKAKERLVADGVDFTILDGEPEIVGTAEDCLTYYVVTLVFEAQRLDTLQSQTSESI